MTRSSRWPSATLAVLLVAVACGGGAGDDEVASMKSTTTAGPVGSSVGSRPGATAETTLATVAPPGTAATTVPSAPAEETFAPCGAAAAGAPAVGSFALTSGDQPWTMCSAFPAWRAVAGATENAVYVESTTKDPQQAVTAFDARSGAVLWTRSVVRTQWGRAQGPVAGAGVVVLTVTEGGVKAVVGVDALTGEERWRVGTDALTITQPDPSGRPFNGPGPVAPTPIANTPTVAVVASDNGALGIDRQTGEVRWSLALLVQDTAGTGVARSPAAVLDEVVMLPVTTPTGDSLVAIDATAGVEVWRAPQLDHPSAADGAVVGYRSRDVGSGGRVAIAVSATDGTPLWSMPGQPAYGDLWALGDGVVVVGDPSGGRLVAYELGTGATRWERAVAADLPGEPQLVAGELAVLLREATLGTLSTKTGATLWSKTSPLGSQMMSGVAANSTSLYVSVNSLPWAD